MGAKELGLATGMGADRMLIMINWEQETEKRSI